MSGRLRFRAVTADLRRRGLLRSLDRLNRLCTQYLELTRTIAARPSDVGFELQVVLFSHSELDPDVTSPRRRPRRARDQLAACSFARLPAT